ncbi:hypothetical protein [Terrimonas pollutisoli]|uniref:hypothetical protein n=1 Tax=Terrimonas pollutisoli TaxID=3034147 RepID=UPI0023ED25FA|nr:hypothetical protein [Terrimonas sp. H1YJ31]
MKCAIMPCLVQIEKCELQKLCTEVKETLAKEVVLTEKKKVSFGTTDLWNARRSMNTANRLWKNKARIYPLV